jgi:hypothetical protein
MDMPDLTADEGSNNSMNIDDEYDNISALFNRLSILFSTF